MWQQDSSQSWVDWQAQENICKGLQHDQVDWAALAQQWISMKDTSTGFVNNVKEPLLPTPPQPPMVRSEDTMEIEEDIENPLIFDVHHKAPEPWQQWDNRNEQQVWHPNQHWTAPGYSTVHHVPPPAPPQPPGYWTAPGHHFRPHQPQPAPYVPSLLSLNVPPAPAPRNTAKPLAFLKQERQSLLAEPSHKEDDFDAEQEDIPMIDAVKRKQLPAWLREGLEKMEQEKIKKEQIKLQKLQQLENLRKQKEEEDVRKKEAEEKGLVFIPGKSKFETDSESETEEPQNPVEPFKVKLEREREALKVEPDFHEPIFKTKEEVFQEMLMKVKRIMTEVLLDVTTVEINSVAKEELSRAKKKASNSALVKGQALQSLTGKLGLGLYDNSDSEEGDEEIGVQKENHLESSDDDDDDKIKCRIQRYKSSFATKELEIERQNRELEQRTAHLERKFLGQESSEEEEESSDEERGNERQVQSNDHGSLDQRVVSEEEQVSIKEEKQERKKVSRWDAKAGKNDSKKIDKSQEEDNLTKNVSPHSVKQEELSSPREVVRAPIKSEKEHKISGSSRERRRSETERYRSDVERSERYRSDTERSERYRSDAERSERYRSDAERSERNRSDAERSERYRSDAERSKRYRSDAERSKQYHSTRESKKSSVARERSMSSDEDRRYNKDQSERKGSRGSHRSDRYSERYSRGPVSRNRKRKRSDSRDKRRERSRRIRERSKSRDSMSSTKREQVKDRYGTSVPERDRYGKEDKVPSRSNLKDKNRHKKRIEEREKAKRRRSPSSSSSSSSDSTSYSSSSSSSSEESSSESSSTSASSRLKGRK